MSRLSRVTYPQRLYYNANVFRQTHKGSFGGQQEFYQSGVELIGAGDVSADAEIVLLVADILDHLSLPQWSLVLGDAYLTRSLLVPFPEPMRGRVRQALAQLDRIVLENLEVSTDLKHYALKLFDLRGRPENGAAGCQQASTFPSRARPTVARLKTLIALLRESDQFCPQENNAGSGHGLTLDLSLIQTFDYYTGLVFEVVTSPEMGCQVLGRGGAMTICWGYFHPQGQSFSRCGGGFVLHTEVIHQALLPSGVLPQHTPSSDWLVVPTSKLAVPSAFAYARTLRSSAKFGAGRSAPGPHNLCRYHPSGGPAAPHSPHCLD